MFWVRGDFESQFLVALAFEEASDLVFLVIRDILQELGCGIHVSSKDEGLILDHGEGECVRDHIYVFVGHVSFAVAWEVAKQIHGLVKMADGVRLVANKIIETVCAVGIDEAVADPLSGPDGLVHICHDFEGGFNPILIDLSSLQSLDVIFARETQYIEGFFAGKCDELARF